MFGLHLSAEVEGGLDAGVGGRRARLVGDTAVGDGAELRAPVGVLCRLWAQRLPAADPGGDAVRFSAKLGSVEGGSDHEAGAEAIDLDADALPVGELLDVPGDCSEPCCCQRFGERLERVGESVRARRPASSSTYVSRYCWVWGGPGRACVRRPGVPGGRVALTCVFT